MKINQFTHRPRPSEKNSFRIFLQAELGRRCARNSQYSLRAFAKFLNIDHATLSQILRGKRRLTTRTIRRLGNRLGLEGQALDHYVNVETQTPFSADPPGTLKQVQQLTRDSANLISDWYHFAILELIHLKDFKPDSRWIARMLGITPDEVNIALTRLIHLGLLEMVSKDHWVDKSPQTAIGFEDFTQVTIQNLSEQVRKLFLQAVAGSGPGRCDHSLSTLAIHTSRLPFVINRIAEFRRELMDYLSQDSDRDDVYQLEISLFPVTQLNRSKGEP